MKATGKQWNDFLNSWPEHWWYDDADVHINGVPDINGELIKPTDKIELTTGVLVKSDGINDDAPDASLVSEFRKWIKAQSYDHVMIELPKTVDRHYFEVRLKEFFGAKVVK